MYKVGEIIEVEVTGIESYGIFVKADNDYTGLIHISEIDNNYIKDANSLLAISLEKERRNGLCLIKK